MHSWTRVRLVGNIAVLLLPYDRSVSPGLDRCSLAGAGDSGGESRADKAHGGVYRRLRGVDGLEGARDRCWGA